MNGPVRQKLGVIPENVTWGGTAFDTSNKICCSSKANTFASSCVPVRPGQAEEVFSKMAGDFMKPVVDVVDQLLSAGVNVTVYNGQLDLIVDTMGA